MKSYICLAALALLIAAAGCAPRLAETPLGKDEKRWEGYIQKSYPAWKAPQTVPPSDAKAKVNEEDSKTAENIAPEPFPIVKDEITIQEKIVVSDNQGSVLSESKTSIDMKSKSQMYVVQKNDTLYSIARQFYKDGNRWKEIQAANNDLLKGSSKIFPGMTLRIPLP
jgi:nucleoid-associated protein YgaU